VGVSGKLCTIFNDLGKSLAAREETGLYTRFVRSKRESILEPMCGSGRFLLPLLQQGYDISGFDLSSDMLDACRKNLFHLPFKMCSDKAAHI
jgi:SAM-dependent methyltransferase